MGNVIRVMVVVVAAVMAAGSATAPARHAVRKAETIGASYDATWSAVIDLFAERDWTINNMRRTWG